VESNTVALLDFDQALQAFQTSVAPLLEVGDAQTWDDRKFKAREVQIVWAALVCFAPGSASFCSCTV
jgi:hypothetical protein